MADFFKNWKSTTAFFLFVYLYAHSIFTNSDPMVVSTTGYIALYSSLFMMFRSNFTTEMVSKIVDKMTLGKLD